MQAKLSMALGGALMSQSLEFLQDSAAGVITEGPGAHRRESWQRLAAQGKQSPPRQQPWQCRMMVGMMVGTMVGMMFAIYTSQT